jgi:hypothetical protein
MGYLLEKARRIRIQTQQGESTPSCYEINALNELTSSSVIVNTPSTERRSPDPKVEASPVETVTPQANINVSWPPKVQSLVDWFMPMDPPEEPFYLVDHRHIVDPVKYFQSLKLDIEAGPRGSRARMGTLQSDLCKLRAYFSHEENAG